MPSDLVLDVSVVIAAVSPTELHHPECARLLNVIHQQNLGVEVPAHFVLELYSVLTRSPRELRQLGFMTKEDPIVLRVRSLGEVEVQEILGWASERLPGRSPTRGADLAYIGVARTTGLPLVSLDHGLHQFNSVGVAVYYPADLLKEWGIAQ